MNDLPKLCFAMETHLFPMQEEDKVKILGANALRVFGLESRVIGKTKE